MRQLIVKQLDYDLTPVAGLALVGHRHLNGWGERWWNSSVSKALIPHAHCSVLVVITD